MNVDAISNGIVIDHISAGLGMRIYELLGLGEIDVTVALMKNVTSRKLGRKDIIKIDGMTDINFDVIGYVDPEATVNVIEDGKLVSKKAPGLPERLVNVIKCKNPRCITSCEQELDHVFRLSDADSRTYRCLYCETKAAGSR